MGAIADIYAAVRLVLDEGKFEADAVALADKTGKTAGQRMSSQLKRNLTTSISAGIGTVLGAGFAIATRGAAELDNATTNLLRDTGLTGEAAAQAKDQLASMYRGNLQGFDQISAALSKVHTDLGLTGDQAGKTADQFLKFATATGQDAAAAVTAFDDILDNWNLKATDASSIMDKLIVSHQKYGGELDKNENTLAQLAPALQAANFKIDDAIALLGLFGAKGLNAESASAAFAKALTKVKSPAELKKLIADIEKEPDAFKRAGLAADLFGAKAGAKLANALGGANLDDYIITMNEAAGATDRARDASLSWADKATLALHNVGGLLAEFGQNFGPLLMVGTMIGPKFAAGIAAAFGGAAGMLGPKLIGMMAPVMASTGLASGTALGSAIAAAVPLGLAALAAIPVAIAFTIVSGDIQKQTDALTKKTSEFAVNASLEQLKKAREGVAQQLAKTKEGFHPLEDFLGLSGTSQVQTQLDILDQQIAAMEAPVRASATKVAAEIPKAIYGQRAATLAAGLANGIKVTDGLAQGIHDARQKPLDAFNNLVDMLKHPLSKTREFERLGKELVSKELAQGLVSADPEIRVAARQVQKDILTRMAEMKPGAGIIGKDVTQALADGLKSPNPQVQANARLLQSIITTALGDTKGAYDAGQDAGAAYAAAIAEAVKVALRKVLANIVANPAAYKDRSTSGEGRGGLRTNPLPPTGGATKPPDKFRALGGPVVAGQPYLVGERGPEPFVPSTNGMILPNSSLGGNTYNVQVQGLIKARDPFEVATQLRRLASFGVLTPRTTG